MAYELGSFQKNGVFKVFPKAPPRPPTPIACTVFVYVPADPELLKAIYNFIFIKGLNKLILN